MFKQDTLFTVCLISIGQLALPFSGKQARGSMSLAGGAREYIGSGLG